MAVLFQVEIVLLHSVPLENHMTNLLWSAVKNSLYANSMFVNSFASDGLYGNNIHRYLL